MLVHVLVLPLTIELQDFANGWPLLCVSARMYVKHCVVYARYTVRYPKRVNVLGLLKVNMWLRGGCSKVLCTYLQDKPAGFRQLG